MNKDTKSLIRGRISAQGDKVRGQGADAFFGSSEPATPETVAVADALPEPVAVSNMEVATEPVAVKTKVEKTEKHSVNIRLTREDELKLMEIQAQLMKASGKKPKKSDLVSEAITLLWGKYEKRGG